MTTYGAQMDRKWTGSGSEVGRKWTWSVHLSVHMSVHPKHFPYLLDEPYARDLQAQGHPAIFKQAWKSFSELWPRNITKLLNYINEVDEADEVELV